ncbi:MAG: transcriptional repressor [Clostridia bacterium]|nr:transcriptional repressor [Clostridia bacterium]
MNSSRKYKTKQRETLLGYLKSVPGVHITVADVCEHFKGRGEAIGRATVYRQLESLVSEGVVNKYVIDGVSPACFEYMKEHAAGEDTEVCYHCKCEMCGRVIHLHCDELSGTRAHLLSEHSFMLDPKRTVFYGLCERCAELKGATV